jgi:hypothetical protein
MPSETVSLEIALAAGTALFNFDAYNPPLDYRKVFARKDKYKQGEDVYVDYCVKNVGDGSGGASIIVKDLDTGATLQTWVIPSLDPGYRYKTDPSGSGAYVGKMPNRNWRLSFTVTP